MINLKTQMQLQTILNLPVFIWVLSGFLTSYFLFFILPIFFFFQVMQFPSYIPTMNPIGADLKQMLGFSASWFITKQTPYTGTNLYPPLATMLYTPLLAVDFSVAYKIITIVSLLLYTVMTLILPQQIGKEKQASSLLMLVFITGLFSYGFQFELERGQWNVIAMSLCFLGIWLYHYHNKYRYFAYFLFSISVQLKVFPLIFIIMFIDDWQDWKNNIKRLFLLSIVNSALFFVMGSSVFIDFIRATEAFIGNPLVWIGNHSIASFVTIVSTIAANNGYMWLDENSGLVRLVLQAFVVVCILLIMLRLYQQKQTGINSYLLLACGIGASLLPPISHDYKLSILAAPIAILFCSDVAYFSERTIRLLPRLIFILMVFILSAAYSSTLFSYTNKPPLLQNNCPSLIVMLLATTCLSLISTPSFSRKVSKNREAV